MKYSDFQDLFALFSTLKSYWMCFFLLN